MLNSREISSCRAVTKRKLRGVEQLDRQPPTDLHLSGVEGSVRAEARRRRPVADRVAAELVEELDRGDDLALRFRHLLAVRVEDPAADRGVGPRHRAVL